LRAYKGTNESADSNQAKATPENNRAPKEPVGLRVAGKGKDFIEIAWDKVDDQRLDKYIIRYGTNPTDFLTEVEVGKDQASYRFNNLKSETRYYFRVASRGSDGETSAYGDFVSEETLSAGAGINWVWILSLIVLFLLLIGLYLYFAYQKKWWPFRKKQVALTEEPSSVTLEGETKELPGKKAKWDK
jgi:hypothetical protein